MCRWPDYVGLQSASVSKRGGDCGESQRKTMHHSGVFPCLPRVACMHLSCVFQTCAARLVLCAISAERCRIKNFQKDVDKSGAFIYSESRIKTRENKSALYSTRWTFNLLFPLSPRARGSAVFDQTVDPLALFLCVILRTFDPECCKHHHLA